jgi:hypothetical protein
MELEIDACGWERRFSSSSFVRYFYTQPKIIRLLKKKKE